MEGFLREKGIFLEKALVEARYDRSFLFDDIVTLNKIAKGLKREFPQFQRDENSGALIVINPNIQAFSAIQSDRTSIDCDNPQFGNFKNKAKTVIDQVRIHLDIEEFSRFGLRFFFGKPYANHESAVEALKSNFLKIEDESVGDKIDNPVIQFVTSHNDFTVNITLRTETNASVHVSPTGTSHNQKSLLVIDIDVFKEGVFTVDNFNGFITSAMDAATQKLMTVEEMIEG